ncbi:MAG: hypothetical protein K2M65_07830, partial [Muribaculaceae bacterium]|nr:hypothetical protein [Muribaculaceae bacterium]
MKIKLYTALAIAAMAASMTSCGDAYWEEGHPQGNTYAFPKPAYTVNIAEGAEVPTSFDVIMTRNNSGAEATITVDAVFSNPAISGPSTVTFAAGSNTGGYTISVDPNVPGGSTFTATLKLAD